MPILDMGGGEFNGEFNDEFDTGNTGVTLNTPNGDICTATDEDIEWYKRWLINKVNNEVILSY